MKRFFFLFLTLTVAMSGTALGAEENVKFLRDGKEVLLQEEAIRKNGKWMISLSDLGLLTGCEVNFGEDFITFTNAWEDAPVMLETARTAMLLQDGTFFGMVHGGYQKCKLSEDIFWQNDVMYLPCREMVTALGYQAAWEKADGMEVISLEKLKMPEISLSVEYDRETDTFHGVIENKEPQSFIFGEEFTLERMTENGWERLEEAEPRDINSIGYLINGLRREDGADGIRQFQYWVWTKLSAGQYRLGIPFDYDYYINDVHLSDLDEKIKKEDMTKRDWMFYYSTHWGKPDFFFEGDSMEDYNVRKTTDYILYGEFAVK